MDGKGFIYYGGSAALGVCEHKWRRIPKKYISAERCERCDKVMTHIIHIYPDIKGGN